MKIKLVCAFNENNCGNCISCKTFNNIFDSQLCKYCNDKPNKLTLRIIKCNKQYHMLCINCNRCISCINIRNMNYLNSLNNIKNTLKIYPEIYYHIINFIFNTGYLLGIYCSDIYNKIDTFIENNKKINFINNLYNYYLKNIISHFECIILNKIILNNLNKIFNIAITIGFN